MTFACLSENEVREKYRRADDKEQMLTVLADLTNSTKGEVRAFLGIGAKPKTPTYKAPVTLDTNEAARLHSMGLSDGEIAKRLSVAMSTVCRWRHKNGLSPNAPVGDKSKDSKRMELYKQGLSDREIGKLVGVSKNAIYQWRAKNNLPANF